MNYQYVVAISAAIVGLILLVYIIFLKKKMRRFVFRNEKIERYFEKGDE
jgi:capsular polysaccharide biosynthesis protein